MNTTLYKAVQREIELLGSQSAVSKKTGIDDATLSLWLKGKYLADTKKLEAKMAVALGWKKHSWNIAQTRDLSFMNQLLSKSQAMQLFIGISNKAGSGKTASLEYHATNNKQVFLLKCREWSSRRFLEELIKTLGLRKPRGYVINDDKLMQVCQFFKERYQDKCQLIIDEADKLRPSALRMLIPLFNECEGSLSVVIVGTENLEKEIKKGVAYARKGYDELDSRFGRSYFNLQGCSKEDVSKICQANGIQAQQTIQHIWSSIPKTRKRAEDKDLNVVEDLRFVKRMILREFLLNPKAA